MEAETFQAQLQGLILPPWEQLPDFGLYMDQLLTYADQRFAALAPPGQRVLTPSMINNYVKGGLVDRPTGKKYGRESLAQLLMLCLLKSAASMETLKKLLHPEDGAPTQALYQRFREAQARQAQGFTALPDPLVCALAASSYQLLCSALLKERSAEGPG